jgi:hypothetical protein
LSEEVQLDRVVVVPRLSHPVAGLEAVTALAEVAVLQSVDLDLEVAVL